MAENTVSVGLDKVEITQTPEQQQAFFRAMQAGHLRQLAIAKGGTGDLRKPLTAQQRDARKAKRKAVRQARKVQRGLI